MLDESGSSLNSLLKDPGLKERANKITTEHNVKIEAAKQLLKELQPLYERAREEKKQERELNRPRAISMSR